MMELFRGFVMILHGDECQDEFDAVKMLRSVTETRFRAEHGALVEAVNAHTSAT